MNLMEKVEEAFNKTGPDAHKALLLEMAKRIEVLEEKKAVLTNSTARGSKSSSGRT